MIILGTQKISNFYNDTVSRISKKLINVKYTYIFIFMYKLLLDLIYYNFIGNVYDFLYIEFSTLNFINGWLTIAIMALWVHKCYQYNTPSMIIYIMLVLCYFIPMTTYCSFGGGSSSFLLLGIVYWAILTFVQFKFPMPYFSFKNNKVNNTKVENICFYLTILLVSMLMIYVWVRYANFRILLSLFDVYDIRAEANSYDMSAIITYAIQLTRIIIPILIVLSLNKRKYIIFAWLLFITLISFSYDGSKTVILLPVILIAGYIFYRKEMISCIVPGFVIIQVVAIIEQIKGMGIIVTLLFRRQGVLLAKLSEDYYRFFLDHPTDIFRNSILGKLGFNSIYNVEISKVIGNNYETQIVNCNNGLLADVFSGIGIVSIVVMPIVLVICFRLLDFVAYGIDRRLIIGLSIYYAMIFMNTTWSTVLLTHGFIIMCIVLIFFPRNDIKDDNRIGVMIN